jgi:hypothetical protein
MRTTTAQRRERRERRHLAAAETRRREITATLHKLGQRWCSCGCHRYCDDLIIRNDGVAVPLAHSCAERVRAGAWEPA